MMRWSGKTFLNILLLSLASLVNCSEDNKDKTNEPPAFYFGADLSYVNQILDHNGIFKDQGEMKSPYKIFKDHGANLIRLRLWHNPLWTKEVYGDSGKQLYNDLKDVENAMRLSKEQGMHVLLDFHYSDSWADPGEQPIPAAWSSIKDINILKDSVFNYTNYVLSYLKERDLMPELVQLGNETNCGMLYSNAPAGFPACNGCDGNWNFLGEVFNRGIDAVNEVSASSVVKTKVILHVADPKNVEWWFDTIIEKGKVKDFDVIGFSYYPLWHETVSPDQLSDFISKFKSKYNKEVMILETAYPWTSNAKDNYKNLFGGESALTGYPYTVQGQYEMLKKITQEVIDRGGKGVIYWEPAWISSEVKDLWGSGSSWENSTFFDFDGNVQSSIDFMNFDYEKK